MATRRREHPAVERDDAAAEAQAPDRLPGPGGSVLTLEQAAVALARCGESEHKILVAATPHECALMLEAKYHLDATISSPTDATQGQRGAA